MFQVLPSGLHCTVTKSKPPSVSSLIHHSSSVEPAGASMAGETREVSALST